MLVLYFTPSLVVLIWKCLKSCDPPTLKFKPNNNSNIFYNYNDTTNNRMIIEFLISWYKIQKLLTKSCSKRKYVSKIVTTNILIKHIKTSRWQLCSDS